MRPRAEDKGLHLAFDAPSGLPPLRSDRSLVQLLVVNLMSNAIKFTTAGEVKVSLSVEGTTYRVAVSDTGPGLSPQERTRIFEPFEQLEATRRKHRAGVGLGLALVKEVTAALGGRIELETEVGRGSTFTLVLASDGERGRAEVLTNG